MGYLASSISGLKKIPAHLLGKAQHKNTNYEKAPSVDHFSL